MIPAITDAADVPLRFDDIAAWGVIVGFLSPLLLNFIISNQWATWVKSLIALGFSAVAGTVTALLTGQYEGIGIPSAILLTAVVTITSYQAFWKQVAPKLERGSMPPPEKPGDDT
ncbi:MAG: hypothetical protein FWF90_16215 [Promicromonosporaceae bacterium]|nr:hypothetical protein [Promicromonosporaceae bacterium]